MQRNQRTKHLSYGLAAFLFLIFVFWIMYANYLTQLKAREHSVQRAEAEFKGDIKNLTNFLLERQNNIRNLAIDRAILIFFENKALGMTTKYGLTVSINSIQKLLNAFQQQHVIAGKTIFPRLLFQDTQGHKLVEMKNVISDSAAAQITTKDMRTAADRPAMVHDQKNPDFLRISAPCTFKGRIVGHLIVWIPYHILFDQFLRTSLPNNLERLLFFTGENYSIPIVAPFSKLDRDAAFSQKIRQSIDQQKKEYLCSIDQEQYLIFSDRPELLPLEVVKLISRRDILGDYNPKMLFFGMMAIFSLLFVGMILLIQLSLKQQINAVKLSEAVERRRRIEQKNIEFEAANERILASKYEAIREREHLNVTLRSIGDAVITTDLDKNIVLINKVAEKLTGWNQEEALGKPLSDIFHAAILGNINLATTYIDPKDEVYSLLQEAEKASIRAKDLTQQLLTFSKGGDPLRETTSIKEVIIDSANFVLHGSRIACHFHIADDLWLVDIDTSQMSQVIQNITLNARHAMPEGGEINISCNNIPDITTELNLNLPGKKHIKISIQDNGDGIPKKYFGKIFDPYFSTKQEGSGLGLAICHSIIVKHDGNISVQSEIGNGTTFIIYLPASLKTGQKAHVSKQDLVEPKYKARIMIMDDPLSGVWL